VTGFKIKIIAFDAVSKEVIPGCLINISGDTLISGESGTAEFTGVPGFFIINASKDYYSSVYNQQHFVHSDSSFAVYLTRRKYNVTVQLTKAGSLDPISLTSFTLGSASIVTNSYGNAIFNGLYGGAVNYSVIKPYYRPESGVLTVASDTTVIFYMQKIEADLRIRLSNGTTPVNNALVIVNEDTVSTNSQGDAMFNHLPIAVNYDYTISKTGFQEISGTVFLADDTILTLSMVPAVSIDEGGRDFFSLWPNPANDVLFLSVPEEAIGGKIMVTDMRGIEILRINIIESKTSIRTDRFAEGNYILRVTTATSTLIRNFSVVRN
jgi:hypothetical protein